MIRFFPPFAPYLALPALLGCPSSRGETVDASPFDAAHPSNPNGCAEANLYREQCGAPPVPFDCAEATPDINCETGCDLDVSCEYLLGSSPSEGRQRAQCGSRCTCESAQRRTIACGMQVAFDCNEICNCSYAYDCELGIPAYAACRDRCPAWPERSDASDL